MNPHGTHTCHAQQWPPSHNVGGDLAKLARDFAVTVPPIRNKSREGVVKLGALAKSRNVISNGKARLAAITAATLHKNLSKDACISEWSATELSIVQRDYAVLDA
jgi:ribonuclease D